MKEVKYLAIDPGETSGICGYDENYNLKWMLHKPYKELSEFLKTLTEVDICICEQYRVYGHKANAHTGSTLATARAIGRIEVWAEDTNTKLIKQDAANKALGFKYQGKREPPRSDPLSHAKVANAHFVFWGVKTGRIDAGRFL